MHLTLEADYAVRIVDKLAIENKKIDAHTISEQTNVPWRLYDCKRPKRHYFARGN